MIIEIAKVATEIMAIFSDIDNRNIGDDENDRR